MRKIKGCFSILWRVVIAIALFAAILIAGNARCQNLTPAQAVSTSLATADEKTVAPVADSGDLEKSAKKAMLYPMIEARRIEITFGPFPVGNSDVSTIPMYRAKLDSIKSFLQSCENDGIQLKARFTGHADRYQEEKIVINTRLSHQRRKNVTTAVDTVSASAVAEEIGFLIGSDHRQVDVLIEETTQSVGNRAIKAVVDFARNGGLGKGTNGQDGETVKIAALQEQVATLLAEVERLKREVEKKQMPTVVPEQKKWAVSAGAVFSKEALVAGGWLHTEPKSWLGVDIGIGAHTFSSFDFKPPKRDFTLYRVGDNAEWNDHMDPGGLSIMQQLALMGGIKITAKF